MKKFIAIALVISMLMGLCVVAHAETPDWEFTTPESVAVGTKTTLTISTPKEYSGTSMGISFSNISGATVESSDCRWLITSMLTDFDATKNNAAALLSSGTPVTGNVFEFAFTPTRSTVSLRVRIVIKDSALPDQTVYDETFPVRIAAACEHQYTYSIYDLDNHIKECSVCHDRITEAHAFGDWSVYTPATCTADGLEVATCVCGQATYRTIEKGAHNYILAEKYSDTEHKLVCESCDAFITEPHAFGQGTVVTEASCTATGLMKYTCSVCGFEKTEVINALEHDYEDDFIIDTPATCTSAGEKSRHCKNCTARTDVTPIPMADHEYDDGVTHNASCTEGGTITYTCKNCPHSYTVNIGALGHLPAEAVHENEVAADCTKGGSYDAVVYCSRCHTELSRTHVDVDALPHTPAEAVHENEVAATCKNAGSYDSVVYCSECHAEISRTHVDVNALPHTPADPVRENEIKADCKNGGSYDSVVYCSVCHDEISRNTVNVGPLGHTPANAVRENEVSAGCETDGGYDSVVYCSVCHDEISRTHITIGAPGHKYGDYEYVNKEQHKRTCSSCSNVLFENHTEGEWRVTIEPTYTTKGERTLYCSDCGGIIRTEEIDVATCKHEHTELRNVVDALCESRGYTGDVYCLDCGQLVSNGQQTNALEHDYQWNPEHSATEHSKKCTKCGNEVDVAEHVYPAKWEITTEPTKDADGSARKVCKCGHETTIVLVLRGAKDATYTETGYTGDVVDAATNDVIRAGKNIPVIQHEHKIVVRGAKEATADEPGYTGDKVCELCGEVIEVGREIPVIDNPQTGDEGVLVYVGGMLLAILGLGIVIPHKHKKREDII